MVILSPELIFTERLYGKKVASATLPPGHPTTQGKCEMCHIDARRQGEVK